MEQAIFRAYDIRGCYPEQINEDFAYLLGKGFGSIIKQANQTFTVVGYDNRASSIPIFQALSRGINDAGVDVINLGLVTTPMYYFAWHELQAKSGIMITASHNPANYNGFKFSFNGIYNAHGEEITNFYHFLQKQNFTSGKGVTSNFDIKPAYLNFLAKDLNLNNQPLKFVFDAGNGTTATIIKDVLERLKINYVPLFFQSDPTFPNHHPDPSVHNNLKTLQATVIKEQATAGFAFDGDGDRIGMVDEKGDIIEADKIMIIAIRDIMNKITDKRILFDVKCSKALGDEIKKLGGKPVLSRTGNSYLRAKIANDNILFGGEYSGHIFFNDRFPGYDDAIYVALRLIEILSKSEQKPSVLLENINHYYATDEIKITAPDNIKFEVIKQITNKARTHDTPQEVITIDGCKIIYQDGFALIRASNTGPNITLRFEATTQEKLLELQDFWTEETKNLVAQDNAN